MMRFNCWLQRGAVVLMSLVLVFASTAVLLLQKAKAAGVGAMCFSDSDCDTGLVCTGAASSLVGIGTCKIDPLAPEPCSQQQQDLALWLGGISIGLMLVGAGSAAAGSALVASGYAYYFSATWGGTAVTALGATSLAASTASAATAVGSFILGLDCRYLR